MKCTRLLAFLVVLLGVRVAARRLKQVGSRLPLWYISYLTEVISGAGGRPLR